MQTQADSPILRQARFQIKKARFELAYAAQPKASPAFRAKCQARAAQYRRLAIQHFAATRREAARLATVEKPALTLAFAA